MPLVKMLKTAAGPLGTFISGSRAHLDDETAAAWIAVGSAEAIGPSAAAAVPAEDLPAIASEPGEPGGEVIPNPQSEVPGVVEETAAVPEPKLAAPKTAGGKAKAK